MACHISGLQILIALGVMEFAAKSIASEVYVNSELIKCTREIDLNGQLPTINKIETCPIINGTFLTCEEVPCPPQGPVQMWTRVIQHPFLWWNCLVNIGYYVGEVL